MNISLIAALDRNNGLGKNNELLCYLPNDLRHFKKITMGKPIIMGHNTYVSIGKALPGRKNIVITSRKHLPVDGIEFVASVKEALLLCESSPEIMVIGGASIYQQFLTRANKLYLTFIDHAFDADVFFPELNLDQWHKLSEVVHQRSDKAAYEYSFQTFERQI